MDVTLVLLARRILPMFDVERVTKHEETCENFRDAIQVFLNFPQVEFTPLPLEVGCKSAEPDCEINNSNRLIHY